MERPREEWSRCRMRVTCDGRKGLPSGRLPSFVNSVHAKPIRWHDHGDPATPATPLDRRNAAARYLATSQRLTRLPTR